MTGDRWVVLGLAHARAGWFADLARWSTTAAIPIDFLKCLSADEVRARFRGGRPYSALVVGGGVADLDRDLIDHARQAGAAVIVVDPPAERDWDELGVAAVLPADFDRADLLACLSRAARPIEGIASITAERSTPVEPGWRGRLIAVTGSGGAGTSTLAMSIAQELATEPSNSAMVLLADFSLDADLAMLHDARDVVPAVQELTEAHRGGRLQIDQVRSLCFDTLSRGYHLLLGLRRHRDWTAVRPRAFAAALDSLLRSYRIVVADIDPDTEGEALTGSLDVEDRNAMARLTLARADVVVVVGQPTTKGTHSLSRLLERLVATGVDPGRIVAVHNRSRRSPRRRAEATAALAALLRDHDVKGVANPVFVPERNDLEDSLRDGVPLPTALGRNISSELRRRLAGDPAPPPPRIGNDEPVRVEPGSLGSWTEQAG